MDRLNHSYLKTAIACFNAVHNIPYSLVMTTEDWCNYYMPWYYPENSFKGIRSEQSIYFCLLLAAINGEI